MFSDADIRTFQDMTESAMPDTATLTAEGAFVDEGGGAGYYLPGAVTTFDCRLMPLANAENMREQMFAGQQDVSGVLSMFYPLEVAALDADANLSVTSVRFGGTHRYEVVGLPPLGSYSVHRQALVRRLNA